LRLIKAGLRNLVVPDARIWHKVSITVGGLDSPFTIYHKTRSRLLMAKLYAPESLYKLHRKFFRDIIWLLFKSHGPSKIKKAGACFFAMMDYHLGKNDKGPDWLWEEVMPRDKKDDKGSLGKTGIRDKAKG